MRPLNLAGILLAGILCQATPLVAEAQDVTAGAPFDVSVTVYRDPDRGEGGFNLNYLGGFALITESRRVTLTPGDTRLRFEGVADGIEPVSAIVTGLPTGVIEKNRDAMLLSPSALVEAAAANAGLVTLMRTNPETGQSTRIPGTIRSAASGVVFESEQGIEALRCSGFAESFSFEASTTGLSATPTLSVRTRVNRPVEAVVQLSYLARGFDWSADYVADRADDGAIDLGGWITLANGNGVSFPNARVQVVAGRLNRETGKVEPIDFGRPILAQCWPQGSTSDVSTIAYLESRREKSSDRVVVTANRVASPAPPSAMQDAATAVTAIQEDLGDLKLYRVPSRTSMLSRQAKQVRLIDKSDIPVRRLYEDRLVVNSNVDYHPLTLILRTRNDEANNLGVPLPSGRLQLFEAGGTGAAARRLLSGETNVRDLTLNEEVDFEFNGGGDVQVRQIYESAEATRVASGLLDLPGAILIGRGFSNISRIEITNARPFPVDIELRVYAGVGIEIVRSDHPVERKDGQPFFRATVPANGNLTIRYQTAS
jgi:hypothetical protein